MYPFEKYPGKSAKPVILNVKEVKFVVVIKTKYDDFRKQYPL